MVSGGYEVIVVGAGGGGAILGLTLAQRGVRVCIIERERTHLARPRVETIQPNGQQILHRLGLLDTLGAETVQPVQRFHFIRIGGPPLCSVDYGMLPPPWNRALVAQSNKVHELILARLSAQPTAELRCGVEFQGLIQRNGSVAGVTVRGQDGESCTQIEAPLVVGADGAGSLVRQALGLPAALHRYRHGYLIALLPRPSSMEEEARYYLGRGEILGLFPAPQQRVLSLYMVEAAAVTDFKARGLGFFKQRLTAIDPALRVPLEQLTTWEQVGFLPCARVRARRWVVNGAALIGDAAHAMNPHVSQGRMQAMTDAMVLAEVIMQCRNTGNWSAQALLEYETARRPQVTMLQGLADEQTIFWNASDPVRCYLRDRVFRGMDRNARLRYQALTATAGLRTSPPLTWVDKLIAVGLLPDPHANEIPLA
jgi:2-polyprenyl-6-methoxyphenol hydroxylase-like FAD-dependent oxidoreductase